MSKVLIVGAGKTGRGFLARLLKEAGASLVFIDKDEKLVEKLNSAGEFQIHFFGGIREPYRIDDYRAFTWEKAFEEKGLWEEIELILVSVGGQNLQEAGEKLGNLLPKGKAYYIVTAENASHPARALADALCREEVRISEGTVFCTTTSEGDLDIFSENYPYLQCDGDALGGFVPEEKTIKPIPDFGNFLTRKLYTYNAASCIIAYLGWQKGYQNYAEAANDEEIQALLDQNYEVTNRVLCQEYGYDPADQKEFAALSRAKFCDPTIVDTVARNARDPQRKLAAAERIMGPIQLLHRYGEDASVLERTAAAALLYEEEGESRWSRIKAEKKPEEILKEICGLKEDSLIFKNIMSYLP